MSLPFPISAPQRGTWKTTLLSRDAWHIGHPWHQRWSQIEVVCSINVQNGSICTYFIPQETIWKPVAPGLMVRFDRQAGPTIGRALNQTISSECNGGLALTTQCQQHQILLPEATSDFYRLSLVIKQAIQAIFFKFSTVRNLVHVSVLGCISRDGIFDCCFSVNLGRMGYNFR